MEIPQVVARRVDWTSGPTARRRRGFSLTEVLAVIGIIAVLLAILLPGLATVRSSGVQATSENNLRQVFTYFTAYATDNRESICPSSFNYIDASYPGRVRTKSPRNVQPYLEPASGGNFPLDQGNEHIGSWADILWTYSDQPPILDVANPDGVTSTGQYNYRFDSPDLYVYEAVPDYKTVFRSSAPLSKIVGGTAATPFGTGTVGTELGDPGYFAANDWFRYEGPGSTVYSLPQIRFPDRSVYLVDSYAGETIEPNEVGWGGVLNQDPNQVDFRYIGDNTLMLLLDGGITSEPEFDDLQEIEERGYRIRDLDRRTAEQLPG